MDALQSATLHIHPTKASLHPFSCGAHSAGGDHNGHDDGHWQIFMATPFFSPHPSLPFVWPFFTEDNWLDFFLRICGCEYNQNQISRSSQESNNSMHNNIYHIYTTVQAFQCLESLVLEKWFPIFFTFRNISLWCNISEGFQVAHAP